MKQFKWTPRSNLTFTVIKHILRLIQELIPVFFSFKACYHQGSHKNTEHSLYLPLCLRMSRRSEHMLNYLFVAVGLEDSSCEIRTSIRDQSLQQYIYPNKNLNALECLFRSRILNSIEQDKLGQIFNQYKNKFIFLLCRYKRTHMIQVYSVE